MAHQIDFVIPDDQNTGDSWSQHLKHAGGVVLAILLVAYLMLKSIIGPHKAQFMLRDVTLNSFNLSDNPILLSTSLEVTITFRNPNSLFSLYYESVDVYATYMDEQVTSRVEAPGTSLGHESTDVWTMLILGTSVPVVSYIGVALHRDRYYDGRVMLVIKLDGKVSWKLWTIAKGDYHLTVRCPAHLTFDANRTVGISAGDNTAIKYQLWQSCNVDFGR